MNLRAPANDAARFFACRHTRPKQTSPLESSRGESCQSVLKPVSRFIDLFQGEEKFCPDVSGVKQQFFRQSSSCCFQKGKGVTLILAFFPCLVHNNSVCI